jgi:hypothetical protein
MKMSVLAAVSLLERSARTARASPRAVAKPATTTTHQRLFHTTPRRVESTAMSTARTAAPRATVASGLLRSSLGSPLAPVPPPTLAALRRAARRPTTSRTKPEDRHPAGEDVTEPVEAD